MSAIETALLQTGRLDTLARQDTAVHRIDPRAKVITTVCFILLVVSFDKHTVAAMIPFLVYPLVLLTAGRIPLGFVLTRIAIMSPFAVLIGVFNPLLDREAMVQLGPWVITGGWLSFASILLRFLLTLSAALLLVATTGFNAVCLALERFRVPPVFVVQLLLLYRYLFVLARETARVLRAYHLRAIASKGVPLRVYGSLVGLLLLRTLDRAQRVYTAMRCRGFNGVIHAASPLRLRLADVVFVVGWCAFFAVARMYPLPQMLGRAVLEMLS
jgi:cobalt/nickel transport system permease protein